MFTFKHGKQDRDADVLPFAWLASRVRIRSVFVFFIEIDGTFHRSVSSSRTDFSFLPETTLFLPGTTLVFFLEK